MATGFIQQLFDWPVARSILPQPADRIEVDGEEFPIDYQRSDRAKRYRIFVDRQGRPRVTIPRRGTRREAEQFARRQSRWLAEQLRRFAVRARTDTSWRAGTEILFRGSAVAIVLEADAGRAVVRLGATLEFTLASQADAAGDLRPVVEGYLRVMAESELPARVTALAALHGCAVRNVSIRNQRSRWGSCSRHGAISLNWRLVQAPPEVLDYVIIHELMHLREMNHSERFWALVEAACPDFRASERWLKAHGPNLL
jgi:predicted metal-dependent hydrolase